MSTPKKTRAKKGQAAATKAKVKAKAPETADARSWEQIQSEATRYIGKVAEQVKESAAQLYESVVDRAQALLGPYHPPYDLLDLGSELVLRVELPGVDASQMEINTTGTQIQVSGQIPGPSEKEDVFVVRGRRHGEFQLTVALPRQVKQERASASISKGVLEVRVPVETVKKKPAVRVPVSSQE